MNDDEILDMARLYMIRDGDTWFSTDSEIDVTSTDLIRFARLIAQREREACAQLAEGFDACDPKYIAAAIRRRGEER